MPEVKVLVTHEVGLHGRPAAVFVQTAARFTSDIQVSHGDVKANAKSIIGVLTLAVHKGVEILISAEGEDADEALIVLEKLVLSNFGEKK